MKSIYLACPYWHNNPKIREERFKRVSNMAAYLMKERGHIVFSPISHTHPISLSMGDQQDHNFWLKQDYYWLERCDELYVLTLPGWEDSYGVKKEMEFANKHDIRIEFVSDTKLLLRRE